MVDVIRDDRLAGSNLLPHLFYIAVFAQCDVFHFRGDNTLACVVHLGYALAVFGPQRLAAYALPLVAGLATLEGAVTVVQQVASTPLVGLHIAASFDPLAAQCL